MKTPVRLFLDRRLTLFYRLLKELNPSVEGCSRQAVRIQGKARGNQCLLKMLTQNPTQLLKEEPEFFLSFTMVISVNSPPDFDLALSDLLWSGELQHSR